MHRPCFILSILLIAGILCGHYLPLPFVLCATLLITFSVGAIIFRQSLPIYLAIFCLGAVLIQHSNWLSRDHIAFLKSYERRAVTSIEGVIVSEPETKQWIHGNLSIVEIELRRVSMHGQWRKVHGKLQLRSYANNNFYYGQHVELSGKLGQIYGGKPGDKFSYRQYMQDRGIFGVFHVKAGSATKILSEDKGNPFMAASIKLRQRFNDVFNRYLEKEEAGVVSMMVLGDKKSMPKEIKTDFINTGTAHVLAISGMNMAIIIAMIVFIFKVMGLPRVVQFTATIVFLFFYAFLTGWTSSVVRACLMASVILAGFIFEREGESLNSLGLAAMILLLANPKNIFNIGFQLSFAAVLAIILLYKPCQRLFQWLPDLLGKSIAVSLAAWVGTGPIIFYHFKMITPVSIVANLLIVPLADLTVALGLGLAVMGLFNHIIALSIAGCLKFVLNLMFILASLFNTIPWGHFSLG